MYVDCTTTSWAGQTENGLGSQVGGEKEACQNGYLPESLVVFARVFPAESL